MADRRWIIAALGMTLVSGLVGCGSGSKPAIEEKSSDTTPAAQTASPQDAAAKPATASPEARLQQSFHDATTQDPPTTCQRPPDVTVTGKSVGKLFTEVARSWDSIKFVGADGKPINYRAIIDTELGPIHVDLWPDVAPNHVRNFIALAQAGYYNGLVFERAINQTLVGDSETKLQMIEAGCPLGTGDMGYGSIGYWLKPESDGKVTHEEGTLGACHGPEDDMDACKFYINLCKAPYLDSQYTAFGKVTQGLDIAQKVLSLPVRNDADYPEGDRPVKPVVIRKVTIETK